MSVGFQTTPKIPEDDHTHCFGTSQPLPLAAGHVMCSVLIGLYKILKYCAHGWFFHSSNVAIIPKLPISARIDVFERRLGSRQNLAGCMLEWSAHTGQRTFASKTEEIKVSVCLKAWV